MQEQNSHILRDGKTYLLWYWFFWKFVCASKVWTAVILYWSHNQVSVHWGILKDNGDKSYHPYIFDYLVHDQNFAKVCIKEIISTLQVAQNLMIVIESNNWKSQCKSAKHFPHLPSISNSTNKMIISIIGKARHGKGGSGPCRRV